MGHENFTQLKVLFGQACELNPSAREAFVASIQSRDPILANELGRLLLHSESTDRDVINTIAAEIQELGTAGHAPAHEVSTGVLHERSDGTKRLRHATTILVED